MSHQAYWNEICRFLGTCATASMATVDEHGLPHNVNVWYAIDDDGKLYFVSSLDSAHSRHMLRDPHVAVTVYGQTDDPMHIHGVQIKGACTIIPPTPWRQSQSLEPRLENLHHPVSLCATG
ncbi:MAG: pyridoxamine 5'-phosphate oxidase family protein [Phycisphaerales bacterium]|nr:pyridoxamine 5'-phosphate oxidase family protein [Phycisphaerales bacterium]